MPLSRIAIGTVKLVSLKGQLKKLDGQSVFEQKKAPNVMQRVKGLSVVTMK
jgi:hypothetical protein